MDQIRRYGGSEGLRDRGLLDSAVATPQASFGGECLHKDLFEMAAAYAFHIAMDQAFVDGNKRTGAAAAVIFLKLNGWELSMEEDRFEEVMRSVAEGILRKENLAKIFREACKAI